MIWREKIRLVDELIRVVVEGLGYKWGGNGFLIICYIYIIYYGR